MIKLTNLNKTYNKKKNNELNVINNTTLELPSSGLISILGASGSGKTTLLNAMSGIDYFDSGTITFDNEIITAKNLKKLDHIRKEQIGYIFQNFYLFEDKTVFNNIACALEILNIDDKVLINSQVEKVLKLVGLERYKYKLAKDLSGGEKQRVAIARALIKNPKYIFADEPTGNLDYANTYNIMAILSKISEDRLVIMVTHDEKIAKIFSNQIITIKDGKINYNQSNDLSTQVFVESNNIYLNESTNSFENNIGNTSVTLYEYGSKFTNQLNLIYKNGILYVNAPKSDINIKVIDSQSYVKIEDERPKITTFVDDIDLNLQNTYKTKPKGLYKRFIKQGFSTLFKGGKLFLMLMFIISTMLFTVSSTIIYNNLFFDDSFIMKGDRDSVTVDVSSMSKNEVFNILKEFELDKNVYLFYYANLNTKISIENFYQINNGYTNISLAASVSKASFIQETGLKSGEIILEQNVIDKFLQNNKYFGNESIFLKQTIFINDCPFKIKKVVDNNNLSVYVNDQDLLKTQVNVFKNTDIFLNVSTNVSDIVLKNDEVLVSDAYKKCYPNATYHNEGNNNYLIVGTYPSEIVEVAYSKEYLLEKCLDKRIVNMGQSNKFHFKGNLLVDNYQDFVDSFGKKCEKVSLDRNTFREEYKAKYQKELFLFLIISLIISSIPLILLFFYMKASFSKRLNEVGVYRVLGYSKFNVYAIFLGEIIATTLTFSLPGFIVSLIFLNKLGTQFMFFRLHLISIIVTFAFILIINVIIGVLPIRKYLKKSPRQILDMLD